MLAGPLIHLEERARPLSGTWVQDSRYGRQVKVTHVVAAASELMSSRCLAYLVRIKHVGRQARASA